MSCSWFLIVGFNRKMNKITDVVNELKIKQVAQLAQTGCVMYAVLAIWQVRKKLRSILCHFVKW